MKKEFWRACLMDLDQSFTNEFSQPPQELYKYIPVRRLDDALPDGKPCSFRATPPNELNDINEINFDPVFVEDEDNREWISQEYASTLTELHPESPISVKDVEEYRQRYPIGYGAELTCDQLSRRYGVTSFSTINNDVKMWSNYADNCKGIVVGYNVNRWVSHMVGTSIIRRVQYTDEPTYITGPQVVNQENALPFMSIKGIAWEYEKEWRLIAELSNTNMSQENIATVTCPQESVSSIYVTHRTSQDILDTITQRLNNPSNGYRIWWINKLQKGNRNASKLAGAGQIKTRQSANKPAVIHNSREREAMNRRNYETLIRVLREAGTSIGELQALETDIPGVSNEYPKANKAHKELVSDIKRLRVSFKRFYDAIREEIPTPEDNGGDGYGDT